MRQKRKVASAAVIWGMMIEKAPEKTQRLPLSYQKRHSTKKARKNAITI
jgi:cytochrome c-type biogenesis protein CcmH/NrfG